MSDNLLGIPETRLAPDPAADKLAAGVDPVQVAAAYPASSLAWATLAEDALADGDRDVEAYAYARTGYHRALDALRRCWHASTTRAAMPASAALPQLRGSYCFLLPTSPSIFSTPS